MGLYKQDADQPGIAADACLISYALLSAYPLVRTYPWQWPFYTVVTLLWDQ